MGTHVFEPHTGEVQLRLEAATRADLYAEAGRALAALTTERTVGGLGEPEQVEVRGRDPEAVLVAWINELVYRSETTGQAYPEIDVVQATDDTLRAMVRGRRLQAIRTAVKAATFHRVEVRQRDDGWTARLVLDV